MQILRTLPLWGNIAIFVVGAIVIWRAGTRLSRTADAISERTGLGQAFVGALLLGGATSLPEIATTVSASLLGRVDIAVNNIFGGVAMQVTLIALADLLVGRGAISGRNRSSGVLLTGTLLVFVLTVAVTAMVVGDVAVFGVGLWSTAIVALVIVSLFMVRHYEDDPSWKPVRPAEHRAGDEAKRKRAEEARGRYRSVSLTRVVTEMAVASAVVLVGGYAVAQSGEQIADETGIGGSFVGAVLIAIATSLPEVSTTIEAARLGARVMAISNIFGTNLFDSALLFVSDIAYPGGAVLNEVGRFAQVGALLGIACTVIYLIGLLERRDRAVLRMGIDSVLVFIVYAAGIVLLYNLR